MQLDLLGPEQVAPKDHVLESAEFLGNRAGAKSVGVGEAQPLLVAKCRAMTAVTAVVPKDAKSVGVCKVRPLGDSKYRATTKSELTESSGEFPDVAKSRGEVRKVRPHMGTIGRASPVELSVTELWLRWLRKSGRECKPASRFQAIQAGDDWFREVVTGEYLPKWHPVDGSPLFRRVVPSAVWWRNFGPDLSASGR